MRDTLRRLLREEGYLVELWYAEGEFACGLYRAEEGVVGHGRTVAKALDDAEKKYCSVYEREYL